MQPLGCQAHAGTCICCRPTPKFAWGLGERVLTSHFINVPLQAVLDLTKAVYLCGVSIVQQSYNYMLVVLLIGTLVFCNMSACLRVCVCTHSLHRCTVVSVKSARPQLTLLVDMHAWYVYHPKPNSQVCGWMCRESIYCYVC